MINLKNKLHISIIIFRHYALLLIFIQCLYLLLTFFTINSDILFFNVTYVDKPLVLCSWYVNKCLPFEEFELLLTCSIVSISLNHSNLKIVYKCYYVNMDQIVYHPIILPWIKIKNVSIQWFIVRNYENILMWCQEEINSTLCYVNSDSDIDIHKTWLNNKKRLKQKRILLNSNIIALIF